MNKIIEKTSSDRMHVFEAIRTLEKAELVERRKSESHKQVETLVLAQMGSNLVNFMNSIDGFRRSFQSLTKTIDEYFNLEECYVMLRELHRQLSKEEETGITQEPSEGHRASDKSLRNKLRAKNWTEALRELQTPLTILRPAWFIDNAAWDVASARDTGLIYSFLQPTDKAFPMVAAKDVGRLAAKLIREDWTGTRTVELEGPSRITPNDLADSFASVIGKGGARSICVS